MLGMAASPLPQKFAGRYEIREVLGQGGMGLVYRAYDAVVRREVALKTLRDIPDPASLQLFYKECDVLASISHPNIIEVFDIGEYEQDGRQRRGGRAWSPPGHVAVRRHTILLDAVELDPE